MLYCQIPSDIVITGLKWCDCIDMFMPGIEFQRIYFQFQHFPVYMTSQAVLQNLPNEWSTLIEETS